MSLLVRANPVLERFPRINNGIGDRIAGFLHKKPSAAEQTTCRKLITQLAAERLRGDRNERRGEPRYPLPLDILLIGDLQDIVLSFLPFERDMWAHPEDSFDAEMLCRKTGMAWTRHLISISCLRQAQNPTLKIGMRDGPHRSSFQLFSANETGITVPTAMAVSQWKNRQMLEFYHSALNEEGLKDLFDQSREVTCLTLNYCKQIFTAQAINRLVNLTVLFLDLDHLQNSASKEYREHLPEDERQFIDRELTKPAFEFSALKLPQLECLSVQCGPRLHVVDVRNIKSLKKLKAYIMDPAPFTRIIDIRGLTCKLDSAVHNFRITKSFKILRDEKEKSAL